MQLLRIASKTTFQKYRESGNIDERKITSKHILYRRISILDFIENTTEKVMSEMNNIVHGFNADYIIQQKRPEVFKQLENAVNEVELPFFDAFIKGGIEHKEERLKSIMLGKSINSPTYDTACKDDLDIDMDE